MRSITFFLISLALTLFAIAQEKLAPAQIPKDLTPIQPANHTHFAFLCTLDKKLADETNIKKSLAKWFELKDPSEIIRFKRDEKKNSLQWSIGRARFVATFSDYQIPKGDLEYASTNSIHWPNAFAEISKHQAHFTITCTTLYPRPWMTSMALSKGVAALAEAHQATGIYWGDGAIVHHPKSFAKLALRPLTEKSTTIPVDLWVGILLEKKEDGSMNAYTDGMRTLGFKEYEIHNSSKDSLELYTLLNKLTNLTVTNQLQLRDKTPIKISTETTLKTQFGKSSIGREKPVIIVTPK